VLKRIFRPKTEKVKGEWRKLHGDQASQFVHFAHNIISVIKSSRMRWMGHVAHMWEMTNAYKILVGKPEGKTPLVRTRE
jgi:hypothetical protein